MLILLCTSFFLVLLAASLQVAYTWIWRPLSLVRHCRRQGIPGFSVLWASGLDEKDLAWSWNLLNNIEWHGKLFYFKFGKSVRLVVSDPLLIQQILINNADCYEKSSFILILRILGMGIFSVSGKQWDHQRQLLGQAFHSKELKAHFDLIKGCIVSEMESWDTYLNLEPQEMDMHKGFLGLLVKMISLLAFGFPIQDSLNTAAEIYESFDRYLHNCRNMMCSPHATIPGFRFLSYPINKKNREDTEKLLNLTREFIKNRKYQLSTGHDENNHKLLLDLMLDELYKDETNFTNQQIIDNCVTFLLAGHETTTSLLTWTMYLLSLYPLWQERARAEVSEFCEGQELGWKSLSHLKTLTMILFESLRLFPPQPIIGRSCLKENKVENLVIPQNLEVLIPVSTIHRDKGLWGEDAEEFRPSRFANGIHGACKSPLAFLPFGLGPRTCIGQSLALLEARTILALMLPKYSWKLSSNYRHCPDVTLTLQPRFGMPFYVTKLI